MKKLITFFSLFCIGFLLAAQSSLPDLTIPVDRPGGYAAVAGLGNIIVIIFTVLLLIVFIIACISIERTKNETIKIRELLENINKINIALYKKEFEVGIEKGKEGLAPDKES